MFDLRNLVKYLLEGLAVAVAAYLIPKKTVNPTEIALIALTAAAVFAVLDYFAPGVAMGARQGAGFGIGYGQIAMGGLGLEGFNANKPPGYEGYDDYDMGQGFEDSTGSTSDTTTATTSDTSTPSMNDNNTSTTNTQQNKQNKQSSENEVDKQNVCKLDGETCSYGPDAKSDQKAYYLCKKNNDQCDPIKACKATDGDQCDWEDQAKDLADAAGRQCQMVDAGGKKTCLIAQKPEGFTSSIETIRGFEGFSKVF